MHFVTRFINRFMIFEQRHTTVVINYISEILNVVSPYQIVEKNATLHLTFHLYFMSQGVSDEFKMTYRCHTDE